MNISSNNKKILKGIGIIFITVLLGYKLPHRSYSIVEYIMRPIRKGDTTFYISGLVPLILIIVATNILSKVEKFKNINTNIIFILILLIIMPIMKSGVDISRTAYHSLLDEGLSSIELLDTVTSLGSMDNTAKIDIRLELKDYGKGSKEFKIRTYFPEELKEIVGNEYYESERIHTTYGNRKVRNIDEVIIFELKDEESINKLFNYWRDSDKFEYELFNEEESIRIID